MAFDKRAFNKALKEHMTAQGYTMHKNRKDYFIDCPDGVTRLVVRVPDGIHGVFIGAQFADRGAFSGNFSETAVRWYICETVLGGAAVNDYSPEDIAAGLRQVTDTLAPYVVGGRAEIVAHLNDFFGNDLDRWVVAGREVDEHRVDGWLTYFGFPPVDPYGDAYFAYELEGFLAWQGRTRVFSMEEYEAHRDYYDRSVKEGCSLRRDDKEGQMWLTGPTRHR